MNILEKIIAHKRTEVAENRKNVRIAELERSSFFNRPVISLTNSLLDANSSGIIAEFKRQSPSKGVINGTADVQDITSAYASNGAAALSVLTDFEFFGGTNADLEKARVNNIPILRKDFIIDEYQLMEARAIGADVILLIAACLALLASPTPGNITLCASLIRAWSSVTIAFTPMRSHAYNTD